MVFDSLRKPRYINVAVLTSRDWNNTLDWCAFFSILPCQCWSSNQIFSFIGTLLLIQCFDWYIDCDFRYLFTFIFPQVSYHSGYHNDRLLGLYQMLITLPLGIGNFIMLLQPHKIRRNFMHNTWQKIIKLASSPESFYRQIILLTIRINFLFLQNWNRSLCR